MFYLRASRSWVLPINSEQIDSKISIECILWTGVLEGVVASVRRAKGEGLRT
jgi:hypothetical protein